MKKPTYPQKWTQYNLAQTKEKTLFLRLLSDAVDYIEIPDLWVGNGRPPHKMKDMLKCCGIKIYTGASSRRVMSDIEFAQAKGYITAVPHFNSITNYLRKPGMQKYLHKIYKLIAEQLIDYEKDFAIDSTGISTTTYSHYYDWRIDDKRRFRGYKKLHIMTGTHTNIITAAVVTRPSRGDSKCLPQLIRMTGNRFRFKEISADAAYTSRNNCNVIERAGAQPFLKPKKNHLMKAKGSQPWRRMMEHWNKYREVFLDHYHKRSNVETTFSMIKRKYNSHVLSKEHKGQVNEILLKVVCHNISVLIHSMFELDVEIDL